MNKWLKYTLAAVATVVVILLLVIASLPFVIDPNRFKAPLARVAAKQNIALELEGPIDWRFYPRLGLSLARVTVAPLTQPGQPLARAESATAAVALVPLLSGRVVVDEFLLDGLAVNLIVDEQGRGNWEVLAPRNGQPATPEPASPTGGRQAPDIAAHRIAITNGSLTYEDRQSGDQVRLTDLSIGLTDVNLDNRPFPLTADTRVHLQEAEAPLQVHLEGQLQANAALDAFASEAFTLTVDETRVNGSVALSLPEADPATLTSSLAADLAFDNLSGRVTGELQASAQTAGDTPLLESLAATFDFASPRLTVEGINAEYFYCQMATQLGDGGMPDTQWPPRTHITGVEGRLVLDDARLNIAKLEAQVENLVATPTGWLDLDKMTYRLRMPLRLAQQRTSASGCLIESKFLRNRDVDVVGCAGSLAQLDMGKQCGLDKDAVAKLAQQAVRYNVEKRTTEKKQEIREELKEKLQDKLGDDKDDSARQLLRNLLRR